MPRPQILPSTQELIKLVEQGWTHQQIADWVHETTGEPVTRGSVSVALSRAGYADQKHRYVEEIPWRLSGKDLKHYAVRMLRLLGRRRAGDELSADDTKRLDSWLAKLAEEKAVVAYAIDEVPHIIYVPREPGDPKDIPIRRQGVYLHYPE